MLTRYDELLCHQAVSTFDHPVDSDRSWTERLWFNAHEITGRIEVEGGIGYYPNRNVIDGYGGVSIEGRTQVYTRFSRELRPRIDEAGVGALSYEVIEGLKSVRWILGENDYGVSFDLELLTRMMPVEEKPMFQRSRGRIVENICRFYQMGRARGWVEVEGERYALAEDGLWFVRDHSWGIRPGVGADEARVQPGEGMGRGWLWYWCNMQFEDWALICQLREGHDGAPLFLSGSVIPPAGDPQPAREVTKVEHDFRFHTGSRRWSAGEVTLTISDGSKRTVSMRPLNVFYPRAGGYLEYEGWKHGLWMGPSWQDGGKWDISDPARAEELTAGDQVVCEYRCGDEVGYGITEFLIVGEYPRYGF